jgi:hypothetical protein
VNNILVANSVVARLGQLTDRGDGAALAIRQSIKHMATAWPGDATFPGYLTEMGPLIFVSAGGYRVEIEQLTTDNARLYQGGRPGMIYIYALVSPEEQEVERHSLG